MPKILFLTTAHNYNDDRIFYHQARELKAKGFQVKIGSLYSDYNGTIDGIEIEAYSILNQETSVKIKKIEEICASYQPDCIICSEPLAVIASKKIKKQKRVSIIYDITEWYPSRRMIQKFSFFFKIIHSVKFFIIQLYAGFISTHFIFGEHTKKFPLAYAFLFKRQLVLPYFPDEKYIHQNIKKIEPDKIKLCYTGVFSKEKGIENFFDAVEQLHKKKPELDISILLVGAARKSEDQKYFEKLLQKFNFKNIEIKNSTSFENFTKIYEDADICFDLRELTFENHHCLPIKIFYYAASGKPVIYTNLKATRLHVDVSKFGYLVNPEDSEHISDLIANYIKYPELYAVHAHNARKEYKEKYNWNIIRNIFTNFIEKSLK